MSEQSLRKRILSLETCILWMIDHAQDGVKFDPEMIRKVGEMGLRGECFDYKGMHQEAEEECTN